MSELAYELVSTWLNRLRFGKPSSALCRAVFHYYRLGEVVIEAARFDSECEGGLE
jgi:hypothetical protein